MKTTLLLAAYHHLKQKKALGINVPGAELEESCLQKVVS